MIGLLLIYTIATEMISIRRAILIGFAYGLYYPNLCLIRH